jgi:membrane fusion protein, copper/silver efflux system
MNTKRNVWLLAVLGALIIGLGLGYLINGGSANPESTSDGVHVHQEGVSYTCSMHPQINQPDPGSCPICGMALIPAETIAANTDQSAVVGLSDNAQALAQIQTVIISASKESQSTQQLSGTIEVNEERKTNQIAQFDMRIEHLLVSSDGQYVRKGQELARVYSASLLQAQQELLTAAKLKDEQPGWYEAVRKKLKYMKLSENFIDQMEASEKPQAQFSVYAESAATVLKVNVKEGDYLKAGMPLFELADLSTVWLTFDAYEQQIDRFELGQPMRISIEALKAEEFDATVTFIDPILNSRSRVTRVRAELRNTKELLKPGMFVKASINVGSTRLEEALMVPSSAVLWTGERSVVYVQPDSTKPNYQLTTIQIGRRLDNFYEVLSGLQEGDRVVVNGAFVIDASAQLRGQPSMMNAQGGKPMPATHDHGDTYDSSAVFSESENRLIADLLPIYLSLKNALVASDVNGASQSATAALTKLSSLQGQSDISSSIETLVYGFQRISKAVSIELQREAFIALSEQLIDWASQGKSAEETLYVQFCPMANNNLGAKWISTEAEIRNPYYGDAMLTCGSVAELLSL